MTLTSDLCDGILDSSVDDLSALKKFQYLEQLLISTNPVLELEIEYI
ncbi:MAG: hypothetical protein IPO21_13705 [Bacteroidales bacterium]|nr:hypothetical protein [Bacteroidales bacterium]